MWIFVGLLCALIVLTYIIYPWMMISRASVLKPGDTPEPDHFPRVFLLMAVHNEAGVIGAKLNAVAASDFPTHRLICFIGLDDCNDGTETIVRSYIDRLNLRIHVNGVRCGKPSTVNRLEEILRKEFGYQPGDLYLLTDANVLWEPDFIRRLAAAFGDPAIGLVEGVVRALPAKGEAAAGEETYLQWESRLKAAESRLFGRAMGPFGGAYMIRAELYRPVPDRFLVDDFFLFFHILQSGYRTRVVENAECREAVSGSIREEFRRKRRISAGNFQNTLFFLPQWIRFWKLSNLLFIAHKLLRWLTPLIGVAMMILLAIQAPGNLLARRVLGIMICLLVGLPGLSYLSHQLNLRLRRLEGSGYFILMNGALFLGFIDFIKGVRTNVWEPTKRNRDGKQ